MGCGAGSTVPDQQRARHADHHLGAGRRRHRRIGFCGCRGRACGRSRQCVRMAAREADMRIRLRQVALVAHDLAPVEASITEELGVELCYRDPDVAVFGLKNALFPIGDKLLEVVSPMQDGTTAGRQLSKRNGDGGYMVLLQVDDLAAMRSRIETHNVRVVFTAPGPGITGLHLHPKDVGGAILSVDQADKWDEWPWAGPHWRDHITTRVVTDLVG